MNGLLACPCDSVACTACLQLQQLQQRQPTSSAFDDNSEPLVGEAEACSVALEGTSVREPLRHPAVTLGILESGNLDGTCEPGLLSQGLSALNSVAVPTLGSWR